MENNLIIGIDLGTTNSLVTCYIDGECVVIPNSFGESLTPSVVSILENNEIVVGKIAKERLSSKPNMTVSLFKRYIGSEKKYNIGNYNLSPQELSSFILKSLKADAESYLKTTITEAIISVPAYFNDYQRRATIEAGKLAGLKVERVISEPTAAALAYGLNEKSDEIKFLVFDLGGGTFDVSIIEIFSGILEVRAVAGNNFLGGEDFDDLLLQHYLNHFGIDFETLEYTTQAYLKKEAEKVKINLSENKEAIFDCKTDYNMGELKITQEEFLEMSEPLLEKLLKPLKSALRDSKTSASELDYIVLVGGSTKMPIIRNFITKIFSRFPLTQLNPDEVVAIGAGIAGAMKSRHKDLQENILTDVCPYTLGTGVVNDDGAGHRITGIYHPIIERNTTIPCSKATTLYTSADNQKVVVIEVYQGESRLVKDNIKLGRLEIPVPIGPRGSVQVDIRYTYDINGILEVIIKNEKNGVTKKSIINGNKVNLSDDEIAERMKALDHLKIHPRDLDKNKYLIEKANRLYEESLDDKRSIISHYVAEFERILERQNDNEILESSEVFAQFLIDIEYTEE